jgi:phage terminase large subunit GpA-like protein
MITSISSIRISNIVNAVREGLKACHRPEPLTLSEWADENFYLSSESSYLEGRWEALPFQVAMLNAIGHDDIIYVNIVKSARVGYSQMLRAMLGYFTEHKSRNLLLYQPTDGAAQGFMKAYVETMIRDVPVVRALAPWLGKKHRDSTLDTKRFSNGKQLWVLGGTASKNYREKSVDVVSYDELAAFDADIEKEGDPLSLGDKRIEGSVFPKSVRGSTPKLSNSCQITKAASDADCYMRFYLPCPHCGTEQTLKFGGDGADFGFKWVEDKPETVAHLCQSCGVLGVQSEWQKQQLNGVWRCDNTNVWTKNGIDYYCQEDKRIEAPESIAFHIWTAYSPFTTWARIVKDFLKAKSDPSKLKTFVNTTLGETWEEDVGEKLEPDILYARREHYPAQVPVNNCVLTAAVDTQDDRFEIEVVAWVAGEESYRISYERLYGDLSRSGIWNQLAQKLNRTFVTPDGTELDIQLACIDSGGHYTDEVYLFCKKHAVRRFIPVKGASESGKPIVKYPRKKTEKGVYLTLVGTDTAKEVISSRLQILEPGEGYMHYPVTEEFDEDYFKQLTAERKIRKLVKGRWKSVWDAGGRRNEPFDTSVYNLAAIRILKQHRGENLAQRVEMAEEKKPEQPKPKTVRRSRYRF